MNLILDNNTLENLRSKSKWSIIFSIFLAMTIAMLLFVFITMVFNLDPVGFKKSILETNPSFKYRPVGIRDYMGLVACILAIYPVFELLRYSFRTQAALEKVSGLEYVTAQKHLTNVFRYLSVIFIGCAGGWLVMMILALTGFIS